MSLLKGYVRLINRFNEFVAGGFRYLILPIMLILMWEVVMRYMFGAPTVWAHELAAMIFAVYFLVGGAYAQRRNAHINVEIFHSRLSPRARAAVDLVTWTLFYLFCGILFYKSINFSLDSIGRLEKSNSVWEPFIWPVKAFLPVSAGLLLLQGTAKTVSDLVLVITGRPLNTEAPDAVTGAQVQL